MAKKAKSASRAGSRRDLFVKVKTARGRKNSSTRWLQRQLNDPYVTEARRQGYRSRAAFKLVELNEELRFMKPGARVVDLGAAPGGWSQVAEHVAGPKGKVVGIDLQEIEPVDNVEFLIGDITEPASLRAVAEALGGDADVVMSDMAAASTGHRGTDHMRVMALVEIALDFAEGILAKNGAFIAKVLQGGTQTDLLNRLKLNFDKVKHIKPPASRQDSREMYVVGLGFRGLDAPKPLPEDVPDEPGFRP